MIGDSRQCGCTNTEASLVDPASTLITTQEARLIVGIDVHEQSHAAALLDDRGGETDTLVFANSPNGYRRLLGWPVDHGAEGAVVGVESPGAYGRCLVTALVTAGYETLQVPAWRTHRERHRQGPGKTDPGDAISIAQVVLRKRRDLGPAMEPGLVRVLGMLELQRRRLVRDRTHPDDDQPLGLRRHLRLLGRAHRGATGMARPLQLPQRTRLPRSQPPAARLAELEQPRE